MASTIPLPQGPVQQQRQLKILQSARVDRLLQHHGRATSASGLRSASLERVSSGSETTVLAPGSLWMRAHILYETSAVQDSNPTGPHRSSKCRASRDQHGAASQITDVRLRP